MGYTKQTIKGISWIAGFRALTRVFAVVRTAVLARLLTPSQIGIFSIVTLVLACIEIITETGINIFLIQEEDTDSYINTAWGVSIIRGIVISLVLLSLSPLIASFFKIQSSYPLLALASIIPFIRGFINPSIVKFQKQLTFDKEFLFRSTLFFIETLLSIIFTYITRDVSGLVYSLVISACIEVLWSFHIIRPTPKLVYIPSQIQKIFHQGKWVSLAGVFNYFFQNGDDIFVGRILGTGSLGLYDMAYRFSLLPITEVTEVISKVTFPVYVNISDDITRLKKAFVKTTMSTILLAVPMGLVLMLFADPIIRIVLGEKWIAAIPVFQVLALFGMVRSIFGSPSTLFLATKHQKFVTIMTLINCVTLLVLIYPFINMFGLIGAGYAVVISQVAAIPYVIFCCISIFTLKK